MLEALSRFKNCRWLLALSLIVLPQLLFAQWTASVGAQSHDLGRQALAFLPNEMWIHAGDSITWTAVTDEPHTITFLIANQIRNPFNVGCPGYSPDNSPFDGTSCVSTPPIGNGQTFTVIFPAAGNFKLSCLFHENMQGTVHVLEFSEKLPHDQAFYDKQAKSEGKDLLHDMLEDMGRARGDHQPSNAVTVGTGEIVSTGGGSHTLSVMRFMQSAVTIRKGDTVEWTSRDPITPHTITFGVEPLDLFDPSANVTVDTDGSRHAVISSTSDNVHSGFIQAAPQDRIGLAQAPLGVTRFRVTFTNPGTFPFICALHDGLGMKGTVTVLP
jgi:plastocyanin